ncbi:transglycosylase domain-containing protein [Olsenella profusa]|uniref:Penicillin-binding protein n=1 Tax=Olsenella profusa TaxID=138595 RepID=A0ABS2EZV1_9ACTN|nr:transglycosylase domain-containing protein [Olsenella profusa]MBM6774249.1 penicillin-binding protein [Olsenella profusa]
MGIRTRRARTHSKTHFVGFGIAGFFGFIALLAVTLALSLGGVVSTWLEDLPDYTSADAFLVAEPTRVYDADGNEIVAYYLQNRRSVGLDEISDYVKQGTVDTEDARFYQHNGVDLEGILRAVMVQLTGGSEGGSTITQQLVRNTVLSDEQFENTLRRKVREAYIAIQMEKTYTKDQILNMYLNTIFYGNGAYGIEAASITYFNKHASDLTLNEAATLVGIPNSPTLYDPLANYDSCKSRRNVVLQRMLTAGTITQEEYDATCAEEIPLNPGQLTDSTSTYPFFTDYVHNLLLQDFSADIIQQGGLRVYTTLDPQKQQIAEEAAASRIEAIGDPDVSAALVSIDNSNGYIVAMVGGQNYGTDLEAGQSQVNMATAQRQAGSSFKTFTLLAAMMDGMSPTVRLDCRSPMQITPAWPVANFNNNQYGIITLARATELSSNTAYGQVIEAIGVDKLVETAALVGIDSPIEPVPASVLGASGVTPLEMCEAYSTIASGGVHRNPVAISRIEDRNGNVVYEHADDAEQVVDSAIIEDLTEVLEGVVRAGYTTNYVAANFTANQPVAGKTGTSDEADNLWFCGFTPQLTTTVWVGKRDSNEAVFIWGSYASTSNTAQPIWTEYMNKALEGEPRGEFPTSDHEATYKPNDSWTFVGTASSVNSSGWTDTSDEDQDDSETTEEETSQETPTTPTEPTTPTTPTPPTVPTTPTEPTTPTVPHLPTEPEEGD